MLLNKEDRAILTCSRMYAAGFIYDYQVDLWGLESIRKCSIRDSSSIRSERTPHKRQVPGSNPGNPTPHSYPSKGDFNRGINLPVSPELSIKGSVAGINQMGQLMGL